MIMKQVEIHLRADGTDMDALAAKVIEVTGATEVETRDVVTADDGVSFILLLTVANDFDLFGEMTQEPTTASRDPVEGMFEAFRDAVAEALGASRVDILTMTEVAG